MRNHIIMMFTIMVAAMLPELAHASTSVLMFDLGPFGCGGSVFNSECSATPDQGLFSSIACKVMKSINNGIIPIYCNITGNPDYIMAINAVIALYIVLWGLMAAAGMTQVTMGQAFIKLLKVMFVFALVTNASFYFDFVYSFVMNAPQQIVRIMMNATGSGGQNFFEHVDKQMGEMINSVVKPEMIAEDGSTYQAYDLRIMMLAAAVWKLIPGIGDYLFALFFFTLFAWIFAYVAVVVRYLLALVVLNFLMVLGPIFLPTILFEKTKFLGDEWIKMVVSYMIQIVVVIAFVLMVEDTYKEFTDLIKVGVNETLLDKDFKNYPKQISADKFAIEGNLDYDIDGWLQKNPETSKFKSREEFLQWFLLKLIIMAIISLITVVFMKDYAPLIAVALGGNLKFSSVFGDDATPNLMQQDKGDSRVGLYGPGAVGGRKAQESPGSLNTDAAVDTTAQPKQ